MASKVKKWDDLSHGSVRLVLYSDQFHKDALLTDPLGVSLYCSPCLFCKFCIFAHVHARGSNIHQFIFLDILNAVIQAIIQGDIKNHCIKKINGSRYVNRSNMTRYILILPCILYQPIGECTGSSGVVSFILYLTKNESYIENMSKKSSCGMKFTTVAQAIGECMRSSGVVSFILYFD